MKCFECGNEIDIFSSFIIAHIFIDYEGYSIEMFHWKCYKHDRLGYA